MENASKALLMSAGVLVGILILSLAAYLFITFGSTSAEMHKENEEKQINEFNTKFTSYVGKENVTIYDVVTVANLATENNINYEYNKRNTSGDGKDSYISVQFINSDISDYNGRFIERGFDSNSKDIADYYNKLIARDLANMSNNPDPETSELTQYNCKTFISNYTKRVYKIVFEKK